MSDAWEEWSTEVRARCAELACSFISRDARDWMPAGRGQYKCSSPLRDEKDPSFYVYEDGGWYDFGLGEGGDLISYVEKRDKCSFREALDTIARAAGIQTWDERKSARGLNGHADPETIAKLAAQAEAEHKTRLVMTAIVHICHRVLPDKIREHLRNHYALTDEIIDFEKIGWVPAGLWEMAVEELGEPEEVLLSTGFFVRTAEGMKPALAHRILFPYWLGGICHYTIGRQWLGPARAEDLKIEDWDKGKYKKHLTRSDKFPYVAPFITNELLWGEDCLRFVRKDEPLFTAEGITDAYILKMIGLPVLSAVTTSISNKQVQRTALAARRAREVIICNDNDVAKDGSEPGKKGALRMAAILWAEGIRVRIANLPRPAGQNKIDCNELVGGWIRLGANLDECKTRFLEEVATKALVLPEFLVQEIPESTSHTELEQHLERIGSLAARMTPMQQADLMSGFLRRFPKVPKKPAREAFQRALAAESKRLADAGEPTAQGAERPAALATKIRGTVTSDFGSVDREVPGGGQERIATFSLDPIRLVAAQEGPDWMVCRVVGESNETIVDEWTISPKAWTSKREFTRAMPHLRMQWTGGDDDVQGLLEYLTRGGLTHLPRIRSTSVIGVHKVHSSSRFVVPCGTLDESGWMKNPDISFLPDGGSNLHNKMIREKIDIDVSRLVAKEALSAVGTLHEAPSIWVIAAWFTAALFRAELLSLGHSGFMLCNVYGTAGCGKTSLLTDYFWRIFGGVEREEPISAVQTPFAMAKDLASSNAIPLIFDEYKPVDMGKGVDMFRRNLRRAYAGDTESRGKTDQGLNTWTFVAPVMVSGETCVENDQALIERIAYAPLSKVWLDSHPDIKRMFRELIQKPIQHAAPAIWVWRLGIETRALVAKASASFSKNFPVGTVSMPARVGLTMEQISFGLSALKLLGEHLGCELDIPSEKEICCWLLNEITGEMIGDQADRRVHAADALDEFVIDAATMASLGEIKEGTHFGWVDGKLFLYTKGIEIMRSGWRKNNGIQSTSPGVRALLRIASEKKFSGKSYVEKTDQRMYLGPDSRQTQVRGILIDPSKIPDSIGCEDFPKTRDRRWGGFTRFSDPSDGVN